MNLQKGKIMDEKVGLKLATEPCPKCGGTVEIKVLPKENFNLYRCLQNYKDNRETMNGKIRFILCNWEEKRNREN